MRSSSFTMLLISVLLVIIILALMIIIGLAIMLNTGSTPPQGETNAIFEFITWLQLVFNDAISVIVEWLQYIISQMEKLSQAI